MPFSSCAMGTPSPLIGADSLTVAPGYRFRRYRAREWPAIGRRGCTGEFRGHPDGRVAEEMRVVAIGAFECTLSDGLGWGCGTVTGPGTDPGPPMPRFPGRNLPSDCHNSRFLSRGGPSPSLNPTSPPSIANQTCNHIGNTTAWVLARGLRCHDSGLDALPPTTGDS